MNKMFKRKKLNRDKLEKFFEYLMSSSKRWGEFDNSEKDLHIHWMCNLFIDLLD